MLLKLKQSKSKDFDNFFFIILWKLKKDKDSWFEVAFIFIVFIVFRYDFKYIINSGKFDENLLFK